MTAPLQDFQFELDDVQFGLDLPVHLDESGFKPDMGAWRTQDFAHPMGDGGVPGRDYKEVSTWGFTMFANAEDDIGALAYTAELARVWPSEDLVKTPRALTALRYCLAGRVRRVYGRPRRWTAPPDNRLLNGYLPITADFAVFDPNYYDDAEQSEPFSLSAGTTGGGGLRAPLTAPLRTTGVAKPQSRSIQVDGDRGTWPILEFKGGANPWVEIAGWKCKVLRTLAWNETVVVDTRPWVRSSTLNGSYARLSRDSRLADMKLPPGKHAVRFGQDMSATNASVTVRWRPAHSSL